MLGPKQPCRIRYRRRAQPSVTMQMGQELAAIANEPVEAAPEVKAAAACRGLPRARARRGRGAGGDAAHPRRSRPLPGPRGVRGRSPEVFAIGKDNKVILKVPRPPAELHAKVRAAAEYCPTRTIRLEEQPAAGERESAPEA
ncbi:MAG: hypothetical protein M5U28_42500 [Sandaracinaceae bacterium]|nr:hypothetical protein [Sandaracinaceae bacterium]